MLSPLLHSVALEQHLKKLKFNEYTYLITMRMFCGTIGLYYIFQLLKTGNLLLYVFFRGLILNHISEIYWILEFGISNTNLLLNSNELSSILLRKAQFWYNNKKIF